MSKEGQTLIEHINSVLKDYEEHGGIGWGEDVYRFALTALTQPASPALKLPDAVIPSVHLNSNARSAADSARNGGKIDGWNLCFAEVVRLNAPHTAPIEPICATGRTMPPHEFSQMVNELRDVDNTQSRRAKIVGVLHAFNIRPRRPE